jgi:hypothetical protein
MSSRQLEDMYEEQSDKRIADILGISFEDYQSLNHNGIQDVESNDGLVYRQYIQFSDDSPKEILDKIDGLDSTNTVYFDAGSPDKEEY